MALWSEDDGELRMIKVQYLTDCEGLDRIGTCASCGKNSSEDPLMVSVKFERNVDHGWNGTIVFLRDECRKLLYQTI